MIISIDVDKAFYKNQHAFLLKKNTQQSGSRGNIPQYNIGHI